MQKSPISIPTMIAIATFVAAPFIGYFTAQASTAASIADINTKVEVAEARNENTNERLDRIENKVDKLLIYNGINPSTAAQ